MLGLLSRACLALCVCFAVAVPRPGFAAASAGVVTPHLEAQLLSEVSAIRAGEPFWVALHFRIAPGWHTYWKNPGDSGAAPTLKWALPPGFSASEIHWPPPQRLPVGPLMNYGYADAAWMLVRIAPPSELPAAIITLGLAAEWLVCKEDCIPESGRFSLQLAVGGQALPSEHAAAIAAARRSLPQPLSGARFEAAGNILYLRVPLTATEVSEAWFYPADYGVVEHAAPQRLVREGDALRLELARGGFRERPLQRVDGVLRVTQALPQGAVQEAFALTALPAAGGGTFWALLFAFAGGLLLNLMPCVLPVLSLKALAVVEQARLSPRGARIDGWVFTLGVLVSFLAVAAVLIILRAGGEALGWGFQLQSPVFVLLLAWLIFALGLMLAGLWSAGASLMGVGQQLAARGGHGGAFFTGVLAVVVATPCTAPFMGAALGFALTQPAPLALGIFAALGLGMAAPWLLLAYTPAVQRLLPRPGPWLLRFKQFMAFPMFATAAWLVWVLAQQVAADGVAVALAGMVLIGFAAWLWQGHAGTRRRTGVYLVLGLAGIALIVLARALPPVQSDAVIQSEAGAQLYSPARLAALRAAGTPVLLNATAAWCITCQVNERVALATPAVRAALRERGVVYLKADWTRRDPAITALLEQHGRSGVPLYLLYPRGGGAAELLPTVLTEALLLERLAALGD